MPTPVFTNSGTSSTTAELEAKIRQLEAENQRLTGELATVTAALQKIRGMNLANTLNSLADAYNKTGELAYFVEGLPDLPELPVAPLNIEEAIDLAKTVWDVIDRLPDLTKIPIVGLNPDVRAIEEQRQNILEMTEFIKDLHDLPQFLSGAESLEDLKSRLETYLQEVDEAIYDAGEMLDEVKDAASQ